MKESMVSLAPTVLHWDGPFTFANFLRNPELRKKYSCAGVYLWIEKHGTKSRVAYIGKASGRPTLFQRHLQHYMGYIGGNYFIPKEFRNNKEDWSLSIDNSEVQSAIFDIAQFQARVAEGFNYVSFLSIFLAPTKASETTLIERNLLYQLKPIRTKLGTLSVPPNPIKIIHSGAFNL